MRLFSFLLLLAAAVPLHAGWRVESSTPHSASPALTHWVKKVRNGRERPMELQLVLLDRSKTTLKVIDLPPGASVAEGLRKSGALAGVNGGYFHRDRTPLGLVISGGVKTNPFQRAKLLSGVLAVTPRGASLLRNAEYRDGAQVKEALQSGPYLVDRGKAVAGLNATRAAERTVLLADKKGVAALLITPPITLAKAGELLATPGLFPELKIERALNLDGGSSTALWVNDHPAPYSHSEWKRVRNAVAVMPKNP